MISKAVTTQISKWTFSHPCGKFLVTAKVGLAHDDSFCGGGSHLIKMIIMIISASTIATTTTTVAIIIVVVIIRGLE